jgi:hypothetical protein
MPTDKLPPFLEDEAHSLRVTWRKSINYFSTFATQWFQLKRRFDAGEFDDRRGELKFGGSTFSAWVAEIGMPDEFIAKLLKVHELALAQEHRQEIQREIARQQRERREAAMQKRIDAEEKKIKRLEEQQATAKASDQAKFMAQLETMREKQKERRAEKARQISLRGPHHPELRALLEASAYLRQRDPVDLGLIGHCYCDMRTLIEQPGVREGEGKDEDGHLVTWGKFIILHIDGSPDSRIRNKKVNVERLVRQYEDSLPIGQKPVMLTRDERLALMPSPEREREAS